MKSFCVAMILWPDIQKKAQDELDSVIGRDRLPTFEDRPRLPFVDAVYKETMRWRPVTPLGTCPRLYDIERHHMYNIVIGSCSTCDHKR